jgi:hypothetical protein
MPLGASVVKLLVTLEPTALLIVVWQINLAGGAAFALQDSRGCAVGLRTQDRLAGNTALDAGAHLAALMGG